MSMVTDNGHVFMVHNHSSTANPHDIAALKHPDCTYGQKYADIKTQIGSNMLYLRCNFQFTGYACAT